MIIPFWSTHHGQSRVTCNMMCISIMTVLNYKVNAIMSQGHFDLNNLEGPFLGINAQEEGYENDFLGEEGLGALFKNFKSEPLTKSLIEECSKKIIPNRLNLLPGHYIGNPEVFTYDMKTLLPTVIEKMNEFYDFIFFDTPSGKNIISDIIFQLADIIIVCLNQNPGVIAKFFDSYQYIYKEKKVFYLIGDYDCNSVYNYKYIMSKYPEIKYKNSALIPYNTQFRDSLYDGTTAYFFEENKVEYLDKNDKCYYFMLEVEMAVNKILEMVGEKRKR